MIVHLRNTIHKNSTSKSSQTRSNTEIIEEELHNFLFLLQLKICMCNKIELYGNTALNFDIIFVFYEKAKDMRISWSIQRFFSRNLNPKLQKSDHISLLHLLNLVQTRMIKEILQKTTTSKTTILNHILLTQTSLLT